MGVGKLNIWVSNVAEPCGTWAGEGLLTIFDCKGILEWPCGQYQAPDGNWHAVPGGRYQHLPFKCGHLQVEVPPGCYWMVAGYVTPIPAGPIHLNYTTHVGITQVGCDETACVKLFNPTIRLCWDWFRVGLRIGAVPQSPPAVDPQKIEQIERLVDDLLKEVPRQPIEETIRKNFDDLIEHARKPRKERK